VLLRALYSSVETRAKERYKICPLGIRGAARLALVEVDCAPLVGPYAPVAESANSVSQCITNVNRFLKPGFSLFA